MLQVFAVVVAVASVSSASSAGKLVQCTQTSVKHECKGKSLTSMGLFDSHTKSIDLSHNNIKEVVSAEWTNNRRRRDWTSPCGSDAPTHTDIATNAGLVLAQSGPSQAENNAITSEEYTEVTVYGDNENPETATNGTNSLSTFPATELACLNNLYSLALSHNKIATLPILGTAAGGLSLTHLAILFMDGNDLTEVTAAMFEGLGSSLTQMSFKGNHLTKLPNNLFDENFVNLVYLDFRDNWISKIGLNVLQNVPKYGFSSEGSIFVDRDADSMEGNVLACTCGGAESGVATKWWFTVSTSCKCNPGHTKYVADASEFSELQADGTVDDGEYRECTVGVTALSEINALKDLLTTLEAKVTVIEGFKGTLDVMVSDTAEMKADLDRIHLKLDAAGCPSIDRRFRRDLGLK